MARVREDRGCWIMDGTVSGERAKNVQGTAFSHIVLSSLMWHVHGRHTIRFTYSITFTTLNL